MKLRSEIRNIYRAALAFLFVAVLAVPSWAVLFSNPAPITINDATTISSGNPYSSNIAVAGLTGTITNVTMTLNNFNHTFPDDFDIMLVGPTGATLIVMSDVGGSDDTFNAYYTISDAGATLFADGVRNNSGTYQPTNIGTGDTFNAPAPAPSANATFAASFAGTAPNGTWSLFVADDLGVDMGSIGNGWSITITTSSNPATTFSNGTLITGGDGARGRASTYASTITSSGLTGAITDVNVTLTNVSHLNPDDIDIILVGPSGKSIILTSDAGGTPDVVTQTITFDDSAAAAIPDAGPMVSGTFKPANYGIGDTLPDLTPAFYSNSGPGGSATLASVFNGTNPNGVWKLYVVDDATTSAGDIAGGWSVDITAGGAFGSKRFTSSDFNGDGMTDNGVYRASSGDWWLRSSNNLAVNGVHWGASGDQPIPGDYDGDGKTDLCVFRPATGQWIALNSGTSTVTFTSWGVSSDKLVPADYDGDGKFDVAIWRPSTGDWWVRQSGTGTTRAIHWGTSGDVPVRGYFNGDNTADFAVFRPTGGIWYILKNDASSFTSTQFGLSSDLPVAGDYDGDGKTDIAVFRAGDWFVQQSTAGFFGQHWGSTGDIPVQGDYDGDSKVDYATYTPASGFWAILNSGTPAGTAAYRTDLWGLSTDTPIPATYNP